MKGKNDYFKPLLWILGFLTLLLAQGTQALDKAPSIFYPLPAQAQGKIFAAQNLFLGEEGGIWIHDVHGKVVFFDGQNILPRRGSVLSQESENITYLNNAFWTFIDNELYRTYPAQDRELVFSLTPGIIIKKIGSSGNFIWLADETHFYTYHAQTHKLVTYSFKEMYQLNQASRLIVNDAKFVLSKWVLATNAGVYLSDGESFSHVLSSGKNFIEKLYFSEKRRELVIGTLNGGLIIDVEDPKRQQKLVGDSHVLSVAETDQEYWIGTEDGLFVHSFLTGKTVKLESNDQDNNGLPGNKIYSLVNDLQGGIWIATDKGIRYFSLFGQKFKRHSIAQLNNNPITKIVTRSDNKGYLFLTRQGLYQVDAEDWQEPKLIFPGEVHDVAQIDDHSLWIATHTGIVIYHLQTKKMIETSVLPLKLRSNDTKHLEFDHEGLLWGATGNHLWSYQLADNSLTDFGSEWFVDAFLPAKIIKLKSTRRGVFIGTDHGVYLFDKGKIVFLRATSHYGQSIDIFESSKGDVWFASAYGVFVLAHDRSDIRSIDMVEENISPKCLTETGNGIWLTSSQGISLYNPMGEMVKHFGDPHGLMNNEFKSGVCESSIINNQQQLLLGSRFGLVTAWSSELTVATPPNTNIIFSQVNVDHIPVMFGRGRFQTLELEYGSSISFLFGALPESRALSLEYRIAGDKEWQRLESAQLTLDHLLPGHYRLLVRNYSPNPQNSMINSLSFIVDNPWYWSSWAIVLYLCLSIGLIAFASWWRSRWVTKVNRKLKAQVALKTDQLRHQSKIVLTNNQQLRKQLQIRHIVVEQMLDSITPTLNQLIYRSQLHQLARLESLALKVKRELALLRNVRNDKTATQLLYDLSIILNSCVDGWREEFAKANISLAVNNELKQAYIESAHFNLDIIFNTLLSDAVKRLYRNQELQIHCYEREKRLFIVMIDCGDQVQSINSDKRISGFELEEMQLLVQRSGGEIHIFSSPERNLVELSWPSVELVSDAPEMIVVEEHSEDKFIDVTEKEWLKKVEKLVHNYYSDPEFSTSSAAKSLFVSERSLQRRFKAITNKTFKEYLNEIRLEKACQYLLAGGKVAQVAFDCGFNDPSYFSQRFKHHFGLSPTQFVDDNE
ncbi:AraC family transcriptional regulator [Vibrio anguillarum]|uniref:AraC family transcriptional regulator n=1 Tax=Vibrio anguillarum TaxID=55601 RepID=UPI0002E99A30|nr:AraC family transcriptional regulator [Vibrio anguillarum]AQP35683.1 hypothetical protein AA909_04770 [Vibrio anguillarum]ASG07923.1 AraC family transcriptional regulator [Vibrio anguillarum]OEE50386.1 hypothetical protein A1QU_11220 [Vibrio anguillarum]